MTVRSRNAPHFPTSYLERHDGYIESWASNFDDVTAGTHLANRANRKSWWPSLKDAAREETISPPPPTTSLQLAEYILKNFPAHGELQEFVIDTSRVVGLKTGGRNPLDSTNSG